MRRSLLLLVLLAALAERAAAQPAGARDTLRAVATASKTRVSVGETFTVEVRAKGPAGTTFTFPPEIADEGFELRAAPPSDTPLPPGTQRYLAAVFALDDARVPPIPVRYVEPDGDQGEIATEAIPLEVATLLPAAESERKLTDVRGPVSVGIGRAFWLALAALALLAGALVWWIVSRRRRVVPAAIASVPSLPPDAEARLALDRLIASGRLAREEYRLFYIELTLIAKRYLEQRLSAPIVEMTTTEAVTFLRSSPYGVDLAPIVRDLTGAADQIKFARGSGLAEEAERHLAATRGMIETLEARLAPAQTEDGGKAA